MVRNIFTAKFAKWYKQFILYELKQFRKSQHTYMVIIAVVIGALGGLGALFFRLAIRFFQDVFFGTGHYTLDFALNLPWYVKLLAPAAGGLIVGPVVYFFAREAKGHGVPEVMESIVLHGGVIRPRVVIAKIIASAVCIGSGGSAGREGPIVQIGSALGSTIGQWLKVSGSQLRTLVACGTAAGIAATFNAPIAGALFAMEVILVDFAIAQFSPIVIASVTATVISRHFLGNFPAFEIPHYELVSVYEMIPYAILGILAAFVALAFIFMLYKTEDIFDSVRIPEWLKPLFGGLIIGVIAIFFPHIFGVGYESISMALKSRFTWYFLLLLVGLKLLVTSVTIGSGGSGGIFAPSLFLGASLGGLVGAVVHQLFPDVTASSGAYALVGMGAVASATMHAPITSILIIFELTNDYRIILPLMVACIISVLITTRLKKDSIYTLKLTRRGIDIFKEKDANVLSAVKVSKIMKTDFEAVTPDTPFSRLLKLAGESRKLNFFVVSKEQKLLGLISPYQVRKTARTTPDYGAHLVASDLIMKEKFSFTPEDTLDVVIQVLSQRMLDDIPIVNNEKDQQIIGYITKTDVIEAFNTEMVRKDMIHSVSGYISSTQRFKRIRMTSGQVLCEIEAPGYFINKTLHELELRKRYNLEVILIKQNYDPVRREREQVITPRPDYRFQFGDMILLMGTQESIDRIRQIK